MIPTFVQVTVKRLGLLMLAYTFCRLLFLFWNWDLYQQASSYEILLAFFYGLRFDVSAILITNASLILMWMMPLRWHQRAYWKWLDLGSFAGINTIAIGLNFVDAEFVKFIKKRSSYDVLMMSDDIRRQAVSVLTSYWYLCLGVVALAALMMWVVPRFLQAPRAEKSWVGMAWRLALVALVILGIRGGLQFKPLHPMDAYFSVRHELGLLTLNTPFTMIRSQAHGQVQHASYFPTDAEAIRHLKNLTDLSRPPLATAKGWNVVVIILESFGSEYTGIANDWKGYTPFFDLLAKRPEAFYFKLNFANARRSIEGLPAVVCGLPAIMEAPILTSDFSNNHFECMPHVLASRGYSTYFLHGAHNGSMHFDTFARIAGFENFVGLNEYPKTNPEDFDKAWGVLDEPMLQYAAQTIDRAPKPVMLSLFTLSSHHPYYIPPKYRGRFPTGPLEIYESIGYTDFALEKFFETASHKPWFNNTIFVLTADHTQKTEHREYETQIGYYRVPLLIYVPGLKHQLPKFDPWRITQHIDILPSVFDLLGLDISNRLLVGQSVFDNGKEGHAFNYTNVGYWYMDSNLFLDWGRPPVGTVAYAHQHSFDLKPLSSPQTPAVQEGLLNIKSIVHYLSNGLVENNLYSWKDILARARQ